MTEEFYEVLNQENTAKILVKENSMILQINNMASQIEQISSIDYNGCIIVEEKQNKIIKSIVEF